MRGKRENFFSREKKFSRSPRAPLTLSRKAKKLFYLLLPTFVGNRAYHKNTPYAVTEAINLYRKAAAKGDKQSQLRLKNLGVEEK